jgi:hypothetical protein
MERLMKSRTDLSRRGDCAGINSIPCAINDEARLAQLR